MKKVIVGFIVLLLSGCSLFISQGYLGKDWPGKKADTLIEAWGEPKSKVISDNGEMEIIYKIFNETCTYTFYTDSNGIITSYDYESTMWGTCKPIG